MVLDGSALVLEEPAFLDAELDVAAAVFDPESSVFEAPDFGGGVFVAEELELSDAVR